MRFTIRDSLWLIFVVAMFCHFYRTFYNYHKAQEAVVKELEFLVDKWRDEAWGQKERHDMFWNEGQYQRMTPYEVLMLPPPKIPSRDNPKQFPKWYTNPK